MLRRVGSAVIPQVLLVAIGVLVIDVMNVTIF